MQNFRLEEKDGVVTLKCCKFEEFGEIRHGFSTRHGGISTGDCASLSFAYNRESEAVVDENFRRFSAANGLPFESLVLTHQTHTAHVETVGVDFANQGRHRKLRETDGLVTAAPGLGLCCFTADCVPILLADPVHKVVGAVHSGWRGTVGRIAAGAVPYIRELTEDPAMAQTAVHTLKNYYLYDPGDLRGWNWAQARASEILEAYQPAEAAQAEEINE